MRTAHRGISFAPYPRGIIESLLAIAAVVGIMWVGTHLTRVAEDPADIYSQVNAYWWPAREPCMKAVEERGSGISRVEWLSDRPFVDVEKHGEAEGQEPTRVVLYGSKVELVNRWGDREKQRFRCDFDLRTSRVTGLQLFPAPR
jgi:hypothetical protein